MAKGLTRLAWLHWGSEGVENRQERKRIFLTNLLACLFGSVLIPYCVFYTWMGWRYLAIMLSVIVMFYAIAITYDAHERELEQANRAQRDFLARMSHELRTPLNAIIGYSELLEEDASADDLDPKRALADIQHIQYSSRYLLTFINDLLDLSKVLSGHVELAYENIEVGSFCEQIQASLLPLAVAQGNRITLEIAPELSVFEADATKLRQCLFNLLSNAVKFTRGGTILFSVSRSETQDAGLRFTLEDSGVGMSSDEIEKIFMPYVQLKNSTSKSQGTGLGLSITHQLVLLMGGSLAVESEKGVGTTCTLQLPFRGVP